MPHREAVFTAKRRLMVKEQLKGRGIQDPAVLAAMEEVPRHLFLPDNLWEQAYDDSALMLGPEESISQPLVVAHMLELLRLNPHDRVLEVGTGSGYQAALLAKLAAEVYTIEIDALLVKWASARLESHGYRNVHCKQGNGREGWPEAAPFDAIIMAAATAKFPAGLHAQMSEDGRAVFPEGDGSQELVLIEKTAQGIRRTTHGGVRFVRMK